MLYLVLKQLTKERATYEYYPNGGKLFGVVSVDLKTGKCKLEKKETQAGTMFSTMALSGIKNMFNENTFPQHKIFHV